MRAGRILGATLVAAVLLAAPRLAAQGFGFGDEPAPSPASPDGASPAAPPAPSGQAGAGVAIGGSVDFAALSFYRSEDALADTELSGDATGRIAISAKGSSAEAFVRLEASRAILEDSPADLVDEAYARVFLGRAMLEGGLIKLAWGKADSLGPLDVLNPLDYRDLTVADEREQRIAEPMLHAALSLGGLSKLELAFLPGFEGDRYAWSGRWTQKAVAAQKASAYGLFYYGANPSANGGNGDGLYASYYASAWSTAYTTAWAAAYASAYAAALGFGATATDASASATAAATSAATSAAAAACASQAPSIAAEAASAASARVDGMFDYPDTRSLRYAQGGIRFTTSLGPLDLGLQYFYGYLTKPAASADPAAFAANGYRVPISYDRYHQAGADFATVLAGLNLRGELAANITSDLDGDDPSVYNPSLAFSLGFDRDLLAGLNLNLQYAGSYRLFDGGVDDSASSYDLEKGTDALSSAVTAVLSLSLLKDALELKATAIYEVEDEDWLAMPSLAWKVGDAELEASAGLFGGDGNGPLGQYADSSYARLGLKYAF